MLASLLAAAQATVPIEGSTVHGWQQNGWAFSGIPNGFSVDASPGGQKAIFSSPVAKEIEVEATVVPRRTGGTDWKTAGIGVYNDDGNFWHLALVESPSALGSVHYFELAEMSAGQWNAQFKLRHGAQKQTEGWSFDHPYVLRVHLSADRIVGEALENGQVRLHEEFQLDSNSVKTGRAMLDANQFQADFLSPGTKLIAVADVQPAPAATHVHHPAFHWQGARTAPPGRFFRLARKGSRWWFLDPLGNPMLAIATDHANYNVHWCEKLGYAPYHKVVAAKYGSALAFGEATAKRLRSWHFNTLGTGCGPEARYQGLAHTEFLGFGADFSSVAAIVPKTTWTGWPDVYDPRFKRFCQWTAQTRCGPERNDPWLLGYFLDNELEWWGKNWRAWGIAEEAWKLPNDRPGKQAILASLRSFYTGDVAAFNADFNASLPDMDSLTDAKGIQPVTKRGEAAVMAFVAESVQRYFAITTDAVRAADPNHLILGCRFAYDAPESAWRAAGATCDVVSVNLYPRIDMLKRQVVGMDDHLRQAYGYVKKPIMVTEWGFPGLDAIDSTGRPVPSLHGAGMRLDTQAQRATCFAIMQRALFSEPFVVGSSWFMWADEPALGISSTFPEDSNYGLVSESDEPYASVVASAARANLEAVTVHAHPLPVHPQTAEASWLTKQPPRTDRKPPIARLMGNQFSVESDLMRMVIDKGNGAGIDHVFWRKAASAPWEELGGYYPLLWQVVDGTNEWVGPEHTQFESIKEVRGRMVIDMTVDRSGPTGFRCSVRLVLESGKPYFTAQLHSIEALGTKPWTLHSYYHYTPWKAGEASGVTAFGADVPDYWLPIGAWFHAGRGLLYGSVIATGGEKMQTHFWKDEGGLLHPDCSRDIGFAMGPGVKWTATEDEPTVAVFGAAPTQDDPKPFLRWLNLPRAP